MESKIKGQLESSIEEEVFLWDDLQNADGLALYNDNTRIESIIWTAINDYAKL